MNTKDILLVGGGLVLGYLLVGYLNKSKVVTASVEETPIVNQAKIDSCNKSVAQFLSTAKFASSDLEAIKKQQFDACMAEKV